MVFKAAVSFIQNTAVFLVTYDYLYIITLT